MAQLPEDVAREMRELARGVKERQAAAGSFTPTWNMRGKNAIIAPGADGIVRLAPRWDILQSVVVVDGAARPNPDYKPGKAFVVALEHWWQDSEGKWVQEFCPKTLVPDCVCPVCMASAGMLMSGAKDDKEFGKAIRANKVMIFNAVIGFPRKVGADGKADIRPISLTDTIYAAVSDIMNGPEGQPQFARGDVTNPRDGFDLLIHRPALKSGERWTVTPAAQPSSLYDASQAAAFAGWAEKLVNLPEFLKAETKDEAGIFKSFYGRPPAEGELKGNRPPQVAVNLGSAATPLQPASKPAVVDDPYLGMGQGSAPSSLPSVPVAEKPNQPPVNPDDEFAPRTMAAPQVPQQAPAAAPKGAARMPRR